MANRFDPDIDEAKRKGIKKKKFLLLVFLGLLPLIFLIYVYLNAYVIEMTQKEFKSKIDINVESGSLFYLGYNKYFLFSKTAVINISADGYITKALSLKKNIPSRSFSVNLEYGDAPLDINIISDHNNPVFYIDNIKIETSSEKLSLPIKPGDYDLLVTDKYYQNYKSRIKVMPFFGYQESIKLIPSEIKYFFESEPSKANIFLNRRLIGQTPISGEMNAQQTAIHVLLKDYQDIKEEIDLYNHGDEIKRNYKLIVKKDNININYNPSGGRLFVSDIEVKVDETINIPKIGIAKLRYSHPGYKDLILLANSSTKQLNFFLEPEYGFVEINSNVDAQIYEGEEFIGNTPLKHKLLAKKHNIIVKSKGYAAKEINLDIKTNMEHKYTVNLLIVSEQLLKDSVKTVKTQNGIELTRFIPKKLLIGAPRSERGQRANEQLRNVDFSRAFYMSNKEISEKEFSMFNKNSSNRNYPIVNVTWEQAALFCNWLSEKENIEPFYTVRENKIIGDQKNSLGYRLPTESEWEFAAKLANKTKQTVFVWGNEYSAKKITGNIADQNAKGIAKSYLSDYNDGHSSISPVGSYSKEPSGLFDMSGNASEWVHDFFSYEIPDTNKKYVDYLGSQVGSAHVIKGSNFLSSSWSELRASFKESSARARPEVGFRIAKYIN